MNIYTGLFIEYPGNNIVNSGWKSSWYFCFRRTVCHLLRKSNYYRESFIYHIIRLFTKINECVLLGFSINSHSLTKSPHTISKSEQRSEQNGSIAEEIEEEIDDISIEADDLLRSERSGVGQTRGLYKPEIP